jgi:Trypsin
LHLKLSHVRVGEFEAHTEPDCNEDQSICTSAQDLTIEKVIVHSQYDTPKHAHDIALIQTIPPKPSLSVSPICLPVGKYSGLAEKLDDVSGVVAGWGSLSPSKRDLMLFFV